MYYFCNTLIDYDPRQGMKITILQIDTEWAHPDSNIVKAEAMAAAAPKSDVYVLPEMWATGFAATSPADAYTQAPLEWMRSTADTLGAAICGGAVAMETDGTFRNRLYFATPGGKTLHYDKRHLFTLGGEHLHYTPGNKRVVANYDGAKFLLLTCYDLRFPAWARYNGDYDAIIIAANWPESRKDAWLALLRARAIENQCYVIGANRTGHDLSCTYPGLSTIIGPRGETIALANGNTQQNVTADIDLEQLRQVRAKFPVLKDRDNITIIQ